MKKYTLNHLAVFGCCVAVLTFSFVGQAIAQSNKSENVKTEIVKVHVFSSTTVVPQAGGSLFRNNEGVLGTISTSGLTPGNVVTLWWAIFNNPRACAGSTCAPLDLANPEVNASLQYGGGYLVGINGRADFSGYLGAGDNSGYFILFPTQPNPAPGIVNPKVVQIHLVIRDHGPANADPAILQQQLTTFGGGCAISFPSPCSNVNAAVFSR